MADTPPPEAPAAKAGGINKLVLVIAVVVAAAGAGGGTYFLTKPKPEDAAAAKKAAPKAKAATEEEDDGDEATPEEGGTEHPVVNLPAFLVNLGDDFNDPHYLKLSVTIELAGEGEEASKGFEAKSAKVRGAILMYLSGLKLEDVQGQENRKKIVAGVRKEARHTAGSKTVRDVYVTEMVVQ